MATVLKIEKNLVVSVPILVEILYSPSVTTTPDIGTVVISIIRQSDQSRYS